MPLSTYTHEVHEKRSVIPSGWKQGNRLSEHIILPVRIALTQSNMDKMNEYVMQVSDPDSKLYGQHWTPEQVRSTFSPSEETRNSVSEWLVASGISSHRLHHDVGSGGWIAFDATVAEAEKLFNTEYFSWSHDRALSKDPIAAVAQSYSLPAHIRQHIDFVTPTLHFDARLHRRDNDRDTIARTRIDLGSPNGPSVPKKLDVYNPANILNELEQCDQYITLICLRALYGVPALPSFTPTNPKNSFGIVEYTPQAYLGSDLDLFFANYSKDQKQKRPNLISIDGGALNNSNRGFSYNGESNLDLEYGMSLVNPIPVTLYQVGDAIESASFNDFLDALDASYCGGDDSSQDSPYPDPHPGGYKGPKACGTAPTSKVISTSYGYNEADLTPAYEIRQCNEYAKLGLLGTTWVYSSGDYGVAGNSGQCIDPATNQYNNGTSGKFNPSFPGTCPYILSVGATEVLPGKTVLQPESACEKVIYSGGGFSNVFQQPDYQKNAVQTYFKNYKPTYTAMQYNNSETTRGYPDVSANGANYIVTVAGNVSRVYGTSASAPVTASILTLINEARLDAGKGSLGFVNPTFYANPYLFNDITNGTNPGCGTQGFSAVKGWDPVTGLGTPNYPKLLAYFLAH
ncbi:subtilisin-like protein [Meira miltonrushii]|uniref:tripeptidyl-peptidase II n=1 Tax=Meira miltonrushii TaxID=1280837 RepID=A0A316VGK1_9BASI|nr:subtilisin-like protein [Meira miltonrushii]PWN34625.1 subtilisin-like protein [Meira miltonrushii]